MDEEVGVVSSRELLPVQYCCTLCKWKYAVHTSVRFSEHVGNDFDPRVSRRGQASILLGSDESNETREGITWSSSGQVDSIGLTPDVPYIYI